MWCRLLLTTVVALLCGSGLPSSHASSSSSVDDVSPCLVTLEDISAVTQRATPYAWLHFCPAACARDVSITSHSAPSSPAQLLPAPAVYGSFPYHGRSSACLAAVHAGLINDTQGGRVSFNRFFRHDWSNSSTQTIFPFTSSRGTPSNGVQSLDVPDDWYTVPSNATEYSFTLRGRGDHFRQRRTAPFPPRAGHAQAMALQLLQGEVYEYRHVQLFLGGYDASHYLHDAWLWVGASSVAEDQLQSDYDWHRLPDPPFTPRSDTQLKSIPQTWDSPALVWRIIGGQTGHRCGLRELGVCSDEVWELTVRFNGYRLQSAFTASWSPQPVARLPNTHCGTAFRSVGNSVANYIHREDQGLLFGGQLSYNDTTCSSAPLYSNEMWSTTDVLVSWTKVTFPAPFSPRRFFPASQASLLAALNTAAMVTAVRATGPTTGRVAGVTLLADVWRCFTLNVSTACEWNERQTLAPLGGGHSFLGADTGSHYSTPNHWGGYTSRAFLTQFKNTLPLLTADIVADLSQLAVNLTMTMSGQPLPLPLLRAGLPVEATLSEEEINDPLGDYQLGGVWQMWSMADDSTVSLPTNPLLYTLHEQPYAYALHPSKATLFVPQAASSLNSSRPALNFPLRRLDGRWTHTEFGPYRSAPPVLSGGHSGTTFFNDVIESQFTPYPTQPACWPPDDPSFYQALGPVEWYPATRQARCPQTHHWEPPLLDDVATLTCMPNGLWMDLTALSIRRCAATQLNCSFPLEDVGGEECEPMLPVIDSIQGSSIAADGVVTPLDGRNSWTLVDAPLLAGTQLTITGSVFFEPVQVEVGGWSCAPAELVEPGVSRPLPTACYNVTVDGGGQGPKAEHCGRYASTVQCTLPAFVGLNLTVLLISGRLKAVAELSDAAWQAGVGAATLSTRPPRALSITSADCQQSGADPLRLTACPVMRPSNISVCGALPSIGIDYELSSDVVVFSDARDLPLACDLWHFRGDLACRKCVLLPWLAASALTLIRLATRQDSVSSAIVSFQPCAAGTRSNPAALLSYNFTDICVPCPTGWSTYGQAGTEDCVQCSPGSFAGHLGSAVCYLCQPGFYAAQYNSSLCTACPLNSYSNSTGRSQCETCELDQYIVYDDASKRGVVGHCETCPLGASCFANGSLVADAASYLLIDQQRGMLQSLPCLSSACVQASQCMVNGTFSNIGALPVISSSGLPVINCCAGGRYPAFVGNVSTGDGSALQDTRGHNVLCATCLPGHSSVNGRCIPCTAPQSGAIISVCLLAFVLVWLLFRLPHDWTGSATLLISSYFLQQSMLFLASESMPPMLSLLNISLLGDHISRGREAAGGGGDLNDGYAGTCMLPLDDAGRMVLTLLSPLIAFALLGVVALLDWVARAVVARLTVAYARRAHGLYRLLFVPSAPKLLLAGDVPAMVMLTHSGLATALLHEAADVDSAKVQSGFTSAAHVSPPVLDTEMGTAAALHWRLYARVCIRLLQLSYTSLTATSLSFFHKQSVGEFGERLVDYPTLSPNSAEYLHMLPFIVVVLALLVCGLPIALAVFLGLQYRRGGIDEVKQLQRQGQFVYLSMTQAMLLQLCAMFRPQYWWMASFVLLRRLLLVALLVSVRSSSVWIWLSMVNYLLLALHLKLEPYERPLDNHLESLTLLSLALQTTLLTAWPPPYLSRALFSVFNTLVIAPLAPIVVVMISNRWRMVRALMKHRASAAREEDDRVDVADSDAL